MSTNTKTAGDVFSYVQRQFGDESGVQINSTDVFRWCNQGLMEIVSKNRILQAIATTTSVAAQESYSRPQDCLQITAVKYNTLLLKSVGFDQYLKIFGDDTTPSPDYPKYWTQYVDSIYIGSVPTITGDTITIFYIPEPTQMLTGGDILPIPDRYFMRLCEFVMSKAYELDEDWPAHNTQRTLFEQNLEVLGNAETATDGSYPVVVDFNY